MLQKLNSKIIINMSSLSELSQEDLTFLKNRSFKVQNFEEIYKYNIKNYTLNNLPLLIVLNKIFFKFKSRNFILFYSQYYNTYSNYFNKFIIYSELKINALFE